MTWKRAAKPAGWYPQRGQVCLFKLDKERPAILISTDILNQFALDVCVIPISTAKHPRFSLRPRLEEKSGGLAHESWAKCDQPTTLLKELAVYPPLGFLSPASMREVEAAVRQALEL